MDNKQTLRTLIECAFNDSSIKPDGFMYIIGSQEAWHIIHNNCLYIFEVQLDKIDAPVIRKSEKQGDLNFSSPLKRDDPDYQLVNYPATSLRSDHGASTI